MASRKTVRNKFTLFKSRLPFGFAILYLMVHVPFIFWWKIGITGTHVGASKRAKSIDADMFGFPFPVFFVPVPFAYRIEQALHGFFGGLNIRFYEGSGKTEWFWFPVAALVLPFMMLICWAYYLAGLWIFNNYIK